MKKASLNYTKIRQIFRTSLLISVFFAATKLLGVVRQILFVRLFGNAPAADAYYASNNLADALTSLIAGGVTLAFIPVLAKAVELGNRKETWRLFNTVFNVSLLFVSIATVGIWMQADVIVTAPWGVTPGFTPQLQQLTRDLMRLNLLAGLFFTMSGLFMAGLQAHKKFLPTLLAPLLYTLVQIGALLVLVPRFGMYGLLYGIIASAIVHLAVQLPGMLKLGWRWKPTMDLGDPEFKSVFSLLIMRLLTMVSIQIMFIARDNFGSRLGPGAVSALGYGWFLMQFPETIVGTAIGTSLLPTLAGLIAEKKNAEFRALIKRSAKLIFVWSFGITLATCILTPIALPYLAFAFHLSLNVSLITAAVIGFMVGLAGQSLLEVVARAYYAMDDGRTYLYGTVVRLILLVTLTWALLPVLGVLGIALADSVATTAVAFVLYGKLLRKRD